ncbi:MAG: hypothetical protein JO297_03190 [Nitrososphaeraceae archaeon]|nr:hypothetical protein [Nitrososphaeraceae archaeon]
MPPLQVAESLEAARRVDSSLPNGWPSANPPVEFLDFVVMWSDDFVVLLNYVVEYDI